REQLVQVLINLLRNALDAVHARPDPVVKVVIRERGDQEVELEIRDNGPGIDEVLRARIFVPFFTTKENGSGIGLSLARQIVWRHDGQLGIAHTGPDGTTMNLRMPLYQSSPQLHKTSA
ncbi:MAG: ATP-binding protein, partial [Bacteroidota bacterium]